MENELGRVVSEAVDNGNGHFPYALLAAEYHKYTADSAILDGKTRFARSLYKKIIRELIESREYKEAFEVASDHNLVAEIKRMFARRKQYLARIGSLADIIIIDDLLRQKEQPKDSKTIQD